MPYSIQDILSWVPLTEAVEVVKTGIPKVLPPEFWTTTENVSGVNARMIEYTGTRKTARVVPYGAPAVQAEKVTLADRGIILLSSREEVAFRDELVRIFREWDDYKPQQMFAMKELSHQGEQFRTRFENLEVASTLQTLATGHNWFDVNGNLLPSSSGAALDVDQGIPAGNRDQLDVFGGGDLLDVSWDDPTAEIARQIYAVKNAAVKKTGYRLKYAIYGQNVPGYMTANETLRYFWARNSTYNEDYLRKNLVPEQFLDLIWVPAAEAFFDDQDGATQTIFDPDQVTFTPEINKATYTFYRGSEMVPSQWGPVSDAVAALKSLSEVFGRGRYAKLKDNPVEIIDIGFTHFLSRLKVPNGYFIADVAF